MDNGASSYRRFLDGDDGGFADIVRAHRDGLVLFLNRYVKNIHTAEELMEETFLQLLLKKAKYSGKSSFKSWLYATARNIAVDYVKKDSRLPIVPIEDLESYANDESNLERSYIRNEQKIELHRALARISKTYSEVLYLVYFEEFSNKEVAMTLGKNARQVRNLLYQAKQALKSELEKEGFVYEGL